MVRRLGAAAAALGATLLITTSVLAGGMAIANLDSTPQPRAGEPTGIGFTLLQHGIRPWTEGGVSVIARKIDTGETLSADARAEGKPGHYVATLTFPSAGQWSWEIQMPLHMESKFPPLTVLPAVAAPASGEPASSPAGVPATAILGGAALAAVIGGAAYLFLRRRPVPAVG